MGLLKANLTAILLMGMLLLAGAVRFYRLGQIPGGLYMDEAADANDAAATAAQHDYRVFYPGDGGREGLWVVMMSAGIGAFGHTVFAVRFWSPFVGITTVIA